MKILVTGGTGYIGSHACVELLTAGHAVVIVDNLSNSSPRVLERIAQITGRQPAFHELDVRDRAALDRIFDAGKFDAIIHFAGVKAVAESVADPLKYYSNNVYGSLTLFEAAARHDVTRVVFSSSATVYGETARSPIREDAATAPANPYGRTKLIVEQQLGDLCAAGSEWRVAALRYFNPVGAHPSGIIGEAPQGVPNNLMPYVCQVAAGRLSELSVFGHDYPTPDGTAIRDYIHVVDLARGHLKALEYLERTRGMHVINLGTGRGTSVLDMLGTFERVNALRIPHRFTARRPGDTTETYADAARAAQFLGWRTELTLADMCRDAWRWQQANPAGYV
ncbi:MAG: UDP-glucose 4-epimerase GalE [Gammaproteobacteria bacterium]|nr:UDP-glucose 4-epimerase GalE [Gammaproteobacteria bacterium]MBU6509976.1 UDP-glucose 4-epimerase GalE [Gammaproteobacteria bacterium]MDE2460057.1 UDP-glucose 4-epimerase GalE [Gammaproteobacteria bacterium]